MGSMMMMMVRALPLMAPLGALTVTSSSLTIRLPSSQSEYQGPVSLPSSSGSYCSYAPLVYCGRGDKKTAKGKRFRHSFGNSRPRNKNKGRGPPRIPVPARAPKQEIIVEEEEEEEEEAVPTEEVAKTNTDGSIMLLPGDDDGTLKQRIRQIIRYQKSLFGPSVASSSSWHASSYSSFSDGNGKLMKRGASSLRRLFDMDHDA